MLPKKDKILHCARRKLIFRQARHGKSLITAKQERRIGGEQYPGHGRIPYDRILAFKGSILSII